MKKTYLLFLLLSYYTNAGHAQQAPLDCGTESPGLEWEHAFQQLIVQTQARLQAADYSPALYTIPVVFHIVHGGQPVGTFPNLKQGQIQSQMTVLNQDLRANAYNKSNYPPNAFVQYAANQQIPAANLDENGRIKIADFQIEFCLATTDAQGNPMAEPGIDRINYLTKGWPNPTQFGTQATMKAYLDNTVKPQSIWDVTRYLNVWITDKSTALTYSGVSSGPPLSGLPDLPNTATASTDGIWCFAKVLGSSQLFPAGDYISPVVDGRTMTHEVGHYLGLRHIWGDTACGNDFCNDTPPAAGSNSGSPTYPHDPGACASPTNNNPDGEMFMNFMDYTMGPAKYMFTTDQMIRAHTAMQFSPFRKQLGTHGVCAPVTGAPEPDPLQALVLYPNPTTGDVRLHLEGHTILSVLVFNHLGALQHTADAAAFSTASFSPGVYFVVVRTDRGVYAGKLVKE
jgi:hypothetical protein